MVTYKNVHTDTLSIGKKKVKPGEEFLLDWVLTEDEAANVQYFGEKCFLLTVPEPEPEPIPEQETEPVLEQEIVKTPKKHGKRNAHSE